LTKTNTKFQTKFGIFRYVTTLHSGAHFGEMALLEATPKRRKATVQAKESLEVYILER